MCDNLISPNKLRTHRYQMHLLSLPSSAEEPSVFQHSDVWGVTSKIKLGLKLTGIPLSHMLPYICTLAALLAIWTIYVKSHRIWNQIDHFIQLLCTCFILFALKVGVDKARTLFHCSPDCSTRLFIGTSVLSAICCNNILCKLQQVLTFVDIKQTHNQWIWRWLEKSQWKDLCETRMHSSRVRTVRCSGRLGGGGCCLPWGLSVQGGVYLSRERVCLSREGCVCPGESVCLFRGTVYLSGCVSQHAMGQTHPPPCGQNS